MGKPLKLRVRQRLERDYRRARAALLSSRAAVLAEDHLGRQVVHVLGDSHANVFLAVRVPRVSFVVTAVGGATALGLLNPGSRSQALTTFSQELDRTPPGRTVVLLIGEVDCGYRLFWLAEHGRDAEAGFDRAVENVGAFTRRIAERHRPILCSVPFPTVDSYPEWAGLELARAQCTASLEERAAMTLRLNGALRRLAASEGWPFLDTEDTFDPVTGRVRPEFVHHNPRNHHYDRRAFADLIAERIPPLLSGGGSPTTTGELTPGAALPS